MDTSLLVIIFLLVVVAFVLYSYFEHKTRSIIASAKRHGILIGGEHFKVYTVYRSSSQIETYYDANRKKVHYFGEMMLVSSDKREIFISEKHLLYCLKVRKHEHRRKVDNGDWTYKWAEWIIDYDTSDERFDAPNDVYLSLY